ncbi:MAG TPA: hypothetical protein VE987_14755 [Polyangiaceae bacterium]|nr:hypothetical protein [Polyangiaceae bacterium]
MDSNRYRPAAAPDDRYAIGSSAAGAASAQLLLSACVVLSAVAFTYALSRPFSWLLGVVPDDAFYYFTIARNIATRGLSSFDGLNATNGYHPGWMAVLVVLARLVPGPIPFVRVALAAAFALHVGATALLVAALKRWLPAAAALAAGALWVINPLPINLAIQGMEASLYIFSLALALWVYSARIAPRAGAASTGAPSDRDLVLFGLSLSLCVLSRTEAIVLVAVVVAAVAWSLRPSSARSLAVIGASFVAGFTPWLVYTHHAVGSYVQHSGSMKMLWASSAPPQPILARTTSVLRYVLGGWVTYPVLGVPGGAMIDLRVIGDTAITAALVFAVVRGITRGETRPLARAAIVLLAGTGLTGVVYALFFSDMQYWYKAQPGFVFFVLVYVAAESILRRRGPAVGRWALGVALGVMALSLVARLKTLNSYPWQRDVLSSQQRFDRMVPEGAVFGAFNAGIPGYFSSHTVVNLDGLVNNPIYDYYRRRELDRYIDESPIAYIADEVDALKRATKFARRDVPLEVVAKERLTGWPLSEYRYLWRVSRDRGAR